ncbi:hypothetical protein GSI_02061 [Ganoderma sinense ZZ0214-1]|uniref:Uncharacterized protein n=1 Tax=Ganoderma sinense ZZ0214-1 TaxID=1077348 RepID=A0A2G8SNI3_9APHY|nr:hypothetical protein GSI_02061 [Ganoderma sinense ZZ0214-1]
MQALKCSYYDWRDGGPVATIRAEGVLIRSLIRRNQGRTFLPSLRSAEWHEYPPEFMRGALFSLVPSSLGTLNLTLHWSMTQHDIETFMTQLSSTILGLHTLRLTTAPHVSVERLSYPPHLRHLSLDPNGISLLPAELEKLVSCLKTVETLSVHIGDDRSAWHDGPTVHLGTALRTLHVEGEWRAVAVLVFRLHAPSLRALDIRVKDWYSVTPSYTPKGHHSLATELGGNSQLARTLRSLRLRHSTLYPGSPAPEGDPVVLFPEILEPLLCGGLTTHLEVLEVAYWHRAVLFTDDEVLQLAQACPELKRLTLSSGVRMMRLQPPTVLPSLLALRHIAQHCPRLTHLEIELELAQDRYHSGLLAGELDGLCPPPRADGKLGHPLQMLELTIRMLVGSRDSNDDEVRARDEVQCYANRMFPHRYRDKEIVFVSGLDGSS